MGGSTLARRESRGEADNGGNGQRGAGIHEVHTQISRVNVTVDALRNR